MMDDERCVTAERPSKLDLKGEFVPVRFVLGGAGSGKTRWCLADVRAELEKGVEGLPLVFVAPKQATFQLERGILREGGLGGYTRLRVVSFERLARWIIEETGGGSVDVIDEEGRLMVLRAILAERHAELRVFRGTARLPGFARQLSGALSELQRQRMGPAGLMELAKRCLDDGALAGKLEDLSLLLGVYLEWLGERGLQDHHCLLDQATERLRGGVERGRRPMQFGGVWMDGFAALTVQELGMLAELVSCSGKAALAFCLPGEPAEDRVWSSAWAAVGETFRNVWNRLEGVPGLRLELVTLPVAGQVTRFEAESELGKLARGWDEPWRCGVDVQVLSEDSVRLAACEDVEGEAILAAREILAYVRGVDGGRYRGAGVILRSFEGYHAVLSRVFRRYEIPFFIDRREPVTHHPLAELTRYALRTVAFGWRREDWFGALKSGLVPVPESAVDELENEAMARGWEGAVWWQPLRLPEEPWLERRLERTRSRVVLPFKVMAEAIEGEGGRMSGRRLGEELRKLWESLRVRERLERWGSVNVAGAEEDGRMGAVHRAVWEQMRGWLDGLVLAFGERTFALGEWLAVLESGLGGLSVGVIPPALDQVLIGTVDRSRNPELDLVLVLGLNDGVFPAAPPGPGLLAEADRMRLESQGLMLDAGWRRWLGLERYYGYIAVTRARRRLVLTYAERDGLGRPLNPSSFVARVERVLPGLRRERFEGVGEWREAEHWSELLAPAIGWKGARSGPEWAGLNSVLAAVGRAERIKALAGYDAGAELSAGSADALYGPVLETSASGLEQFAACPFRFFVQAGLRARERRRYEVDVREKGSFQHEVLARFHRELEAEGRRWRDIEPLAARERVGRIAREMAVEYREGLFGVAPERLFEAERLGRLMQDYIEVAVGWMGAYGFDPVAVEVGFGGRSDVLPAWELGVGEGRRLAFRGKIDRVDLALVPGTGEGLCVVLDYKSGHRQVDELLMANGIQIQLPAYLAALRGLGEARAFFGVERLVPAGVFYVNLRGRFEAASDRREVLGSAVEARRRAYRHVGRFNARYLPVLDRRRDVTEGEQFNYRLTEAGAIHGSCREPMEEAAFEGMLDRVRDWMQEAGGRIYGGDVSIDPYRRGAELACDHCDVRSICRIDPWTHRYRALGQVRTESGKGEP